MTESIIQKTCRTCSQVFAITYFHKNKSKQDGFGNECKSCARKKQKIYESGLRKRKQIPVLQEKFCSKCNLTKITSAFRRDFGRKDGYQSSCKICVDKWNNTPENKIKVAIRKRDTWSNKTSQEKYAVRLKKVYGMSLEKYEELFNAQNKKCAVCQKQASPFSLQVDHCHITNKIRGLLCTNCNSGIGKLGDTTEGLLKAIEYLRGNN